MIIVKLMGGLGNQMFQYAAGRRIAHDHACELKVDPSLLLDHSTGRHLVNRTYDLDIFNLEVTWATRSERRWFNPNGLSVPEKILYRLRRVVLGNGAYQAPSFRFDQGLVGRAVPPKYLEGLWQSYKYFEPIGNLIRLDFTFRQELPEETTGLVESIKHPSAICLNVRRTDFVTCPQNESILGFVGLDYYRQATEMILNRVGTEARFFVFSDEIDWCRNELRWLPNHPTFIGHNFAGPKFSHYLHLMTLASHFIIPNSTFAWWAAWLSLNPRKIVVAPKQWFKDQRLDASDLCPPPWIRI